MVINDKVRVIYLDEEDIGFGIEEGVVGVIISEDFNNEKNTLNSEDIYNVKLSCEITNNPTNLNYDGTYQLYRRQLEIIA
jgi:translation elongation factor EF-1beta